jgi:hypothetical protein
MLMDEVIWRVGLLQTHLGTLTLMAMIPVGTVGLLGTTLVLYQMSPR